MCAMQSSSLLGKLAYVIQRTSFTPKDLCSGDGGEFQHFSKGNSSQNCSCRAPVGLLKTDLYLFLAESESGLHSLQQEREYFVFAI